MATAFQDLWQGYQYPPQPVGWVLRETHKSNWVRFHSLPESKRYATTDHEKSIVLERQNAIAEDILGAGGDCWLVTSIMAKAGRQRWLRPTRALLQRFEMRRQWSFVYDSEQPAEFVYATRLKWVSGAFDEALAEIADDKLEALWMSEHTGAIFAPYDGGVDCIMPNPVAMEDLRHRHRAWLSAHPEGL